jgi:hypothetical protein
MDDDTANTTQPTAQAGAVDDLAGLFGSSNATSTTSQQTSPFTVPQQKASTADILSMFGHSPAQGPALSQPQPRPMAPGYGSYSSASSGGTLGGGGMGATGPWQSPGQGGYQAQMGGQIMLPGTPQNQIKGSTSSGSRTGTPSVAAASSTSNSANPTTSAAPAQKDPFADLAGLF